MVEVKMVELTTTSGIKMKVNAALIGFCHRMKKSPPAAPSDATWVQVSGCGSIEVTETPEEIVSKMEHF
jgi:hypothetical protein